MPNGSQCGEANGKCRDPDYCSEYRRPCRQSDGRSKRTNELTSSIVPRGTSFHRAVELEYSPIACGAVRLS